MLLNANRSVLHLDLDTFFISVERLKNREFIGKPLIVGGKNDRGVVAACSYETRRFGVHSAMPAHMARRLCPEAIFISGDMESYSKYSKVVTEIIREEAPLFEKSSIDEFYVDLTGMDRFFGSFKWANELKQHVVKESGLPISFGLSINKMVSKVATGEAKPNGERYIEQGAERDFLAPMDVAKIPMIGKKTEMLLKSMGIRKVRTLRDMPVEMMDHLMGKNGQMLWKKANGIDESPVVPYVEAKSMSTERTFDKDTINTRFLKALLLSMTEKLTHKLRESNKLTSCITVKIRYSNFDTFSKQMKIPYTSNDTVLIEKVMQLFEKLYDRRLMIRLVGVRLSGLVQGNYQISLFDDTYESIKLYQAIDKIKSKYGAASLMRAQGLGIMPKKEFVNAFAKT